MKYNIQISCSKDSLKLVRQFVKDSLSGHGIDDVDMASMVLAMDEMCANLIIHSHHCNMDEYFEIEILVKEGDEVRFKILDDHEIFDIETYTSPSLNELVKTQRKGGIGLILVKKIMDKITIQRENGKNCCCLSKKLDD